ncbi:unnamed protein product [Periconia digitata]|uniref:amidase n=1 Tax=Periconia digitata TaxID=1303443 RepID=A0A9W4UHD0_9PLEO|nr:unnamed protein product [Periconia digitata]
MRLTSAQHETIIYVPGHSSIAIYQAAIAKQLTRISAMNRAEKKQWETVSSQKKEEQWKRIPSEWRLPVPPPQQTTNLLPLIRQSNILTEQELDITENYDATALAAAIRTRKLKVVDVTRAFCKRAALAHQLTNCLTEIFFHDALDRARELDAHLDAGNPPLGLLHGVPVSLKDTFKVKGYDSSIGIAALCFNPATENSSLVDVLLRAGAILYCKTNVPQTLMALDSHNNVFGRTINPSNTALTPGGSSGGEGALLAMRGSILGVGTDVGGSIRIPSMCNSLYGVKPSWQRVPFAGQEDGQKRGHDKIGVPASAGPMAHSMRDVELFFAAVAEQKPWEHDPDVLLLPWNSVSTSGPAIPKKRKLTIGVVRTDGITTPHPPIANLLDEVATTLAQSDITVVEMDITPLLSQCQSLLNAFFSAEGGNTIFDLLESFNEPLSPWLQSRLRRNPSKDLDQLQELHAKRTVLQKKFLSIWKTQDGEGIDAFICPVAPHPVPPIDTYNTVSYTSSFVLLDFPAGVVPVRRFTSSDITGELDDGPPIGRWDKYNRTLWKNFDRAIYVDSPLCIQIVAPKLQEPKLVHVMSVLDQVLSSRAQIDATAKRSIEAKL